MYFEYRMKYIGPLLLLLLTGCGHNVLLVSKKPYYTECNYKRDDFPHILEQYVAYDHPHIIDEENRQELTFIFTDTAAAISKRYINLRRDSSIVKCYYQSSSIWHVGNKIRATGRIKVQSWQSKNVTLKLNLHIYEPHIRAPVRYNGARTFTGKLNPPDACYHSYIINCLLNTNPVPVACLTRLGILQTENNYISDSEAGCDGTVAFNKDVYYSVITVPDTVGTCLDYYLVVYNRATGEGTASRFLYTGCDIDYSQMHYTIYEHQWLGNAIRVTATTTTFTNVYMNADGQNVDKLEEHEQTLYKITDEGFIEVVED